MQLEAWQIDGDGFHFGRHGLGQEETGSHVPSDSLFAAVLSRLGALRGSAAVEALVEAMRGDVPPLVLSSAFPRAGGVRFFPTPLRPPDGMKPGSPRSKDLKQVKLLSARLFERMLQGARLADLAGAAVKLHDGALLLTNEEWPLLPASVQTDAKVWHIEKRARVTIGRAAPGSQIYFTGRTTFQAECGLWFAIRWLRRTDELAQILAEVMAELGDSGLGGERSAGFGRCAITPAGTLDLPEVGQGPWVSLSRYLPRPEEVSALQHEQSAYAIETIGGWVESPVSKSERRRAVRLIAEGAVLGPVSRAVPGQIVDVQPDYNGKRPLGHAVWRSGLALAVGWGAAEGGGNQA